jgi:hypothetical protein
MLYAAMKLTTMVVIAHKNNRIKLKAKPTGTTLGSRLIKLKTSPRILVRPSLHSSKRTNH